PARNGDAAVAERLTGELAGHPDFIEQGERLPTRLRDALELPGAMSDDVFVLEDFRRLERRGVAELLGVEEDQQRAGGGSELARLVFDRACIDHVLGGERLRDV